MKSYYACREANGDIIIIKSGSIKEARTDATVYGATVIRRLKKAEVKHIPEHKEFFACKEKTERQTIWDRKKARRQGKHIPAPKRGIKRQPMNNSLKMIRDYNSTPRFAYELEG